jgi:hypothetical protein
MAGKQEIEETENSDAGQYTLTSGRANVEVQNIQHEK